MAYINPTSTEQLGEPRSWTLKSTFTAIRKHFRAQSDYQHLMNLSDHRLKDMGIRREDIMQKQSLPILWDRT